jgi:hypothetical protein
LFLTMPQGVSTILVSPIRISNLGSVQHHHLTPAIRNSSQHSRPITLVAPTAVSSIHVRRIRQFASVNAGNRKFDQPFMWCGKLW